jgi:hypothetical protein
MKILWNHNNNLQITFIAACVTFLRTAPSTFLEKKSTISVLHVSQEDCNA